MEGTPEQKLQRTSLIKEEVRLSQILREARDLYHSLERQTGRVIKKRYDLEKKMTPVTLVKAGVSGVPKKVKGAKTEAPIDIDAVIAKMGPDQLAALLESLQKE